MYNGWLLLQAQRKEKTAKSQQLESQRNLIELQKIISVQGPIVEKLSQKLTLFQGYYQQFAKSLSETTHRLPIEGIHFDQASNYNGIDSSWYLCCNKVVKF